MFIYTLMVFEDDELCAGIILAINEQEEQEIQKSIKSLWNKESIGLVPGGRKDKIAFIME